MTNPENPWGQPDQGGQQPGQPPGSQWGQPPASQWGQPPASQWGQPPSPQWGQQPGQNPGGHNPGGQNAQFGQFGQAPGGPSPYLAPPQPGIIPLRPITLGEIYDGSIKAIRANPAVMFGFTAIVVAIISVIELFLTIKLFSDLDAFLGAMNSSVAPTSADVMSLLSASLGQMAFSTVVNLVMSTVLNGLLIYAVAQAVIGRKPTLGQTWAMVKDRILPLLGLTIVVSIITLAPFLVLIGLLLIVSSTGSAGMVALVGVGGLLISVVAAFAFMTLTTLATPALVLERTGIFTAIKRAWRLAKPHFWRILGIVLLTNVLVAILGSIVATPFSMVIGFMPTASNTSVAALSVVGAAIGSVIVAPFMAAVISLLYIDVRIRSEALDVELAAAARQE